MQYLVVENKNYVLLGPTNWRPRFIQSEFDDLDIAFTVPPTEAGYIKVIDNAGNDTGIEIFPVTLIFPEHEPKLQQLAGPYYTYENNEALGTFTVQERDIYEIRGILKAETSAQRYAREISGTTVQIQGYELKLDTSREGRIRYTDLLNNIGDSTINYKVDNSFITMNKADLQLLVSTVFNYVQDQFAWESNIYSIIDLASSLIELQNVLSTHLNVVPEPAPQPPTG